MNRRSFLKGMVGAASALILPIEHEKRFFQLDRTMLSTGNKEFADFWNDMGRVPLDKRLTHIEIEYSDVRKAFVEAKRRIDRELEEALIHGQDRIVNIDPMGPQQYSIGFNPYLPKTYVYIDERWRGV